jgi:hypothetical protein
MILSNLPGRTGAVVFGNLGTIIAVQVSWTQWHSVGWAVAHGLCGWLYPIFWALGWTESVAF